MNPTGAEPSEWAVVYKRDQEHRAQLGTRFVDARQQRRFAVHVSLVKKAYDLDDGETCLYRSDPGVIRIDSAVPLAHSSECCCSRGTVCRLVSVEVTSDVTNTSEETEQITWYSDWLSRRFVFWTAGMNPAGAEPCDRTVVSKCGQEPRAQFDASEETEQMIWYSDVWSCRFVAWTAGMNPAGAEPSKWTVISKCGQEPRAQFGARFTDLQRCRFARLVHLVKKGVRSGRWRNLLAPQ